MTNAPPHNFSTFTRRCSHCLRTVPFWDIIAIGEPAEYTTSNSACISNDCATTRYLAHHGKLKMIWLGHDVKWYQDTDCSAISTSESNVEVGIENTSAEQNVERSSMAPTGHWIFPSQSGFLKTCHPPERRNKDDPRKRIFDLKRFIQKLHQYHKILPPGSITEVPDPTGPGPAILQHTGRAALHSLLITNPTPLPVSPSALEELTHLMWNLDKNPIRARKTLLRSAYETWKLSLMGEVEMLDQRLGLDVENQVAELMAELNDRGMGYIEIVEDLEERLREGKAVVRRGARDVDVRRNIVIAEVGRWRVGLGRAGLGRGVLMRVLMGN